MQLDSVMINISWFCNLHNNEATSCPYCWVTAAEADRSRRLDHSAEAWLEAIRKHIPPSAVLDFVGGEPTIFPEFHRLIEQISQTHRWAVTSNLCGETWKSFKKAPLANCVSWTASYHPTSPDSLDGFAAKCLELAHHYPVSVNIVDHPSHNSQAEAALLRKHGLKVYESPYEEVRNLNTAGSVPLSCNGGHSHITIDPRGFVYKCLTMQRRADQERWRLGNVFEGSIAWPAKRHICFLPCDQFYTLDNKHFTHDMWGLDVREIELPATIEIESYRMEFNAPSSPRKDFIQRSLPQSIAGIAGADSADKNDRQARL